MILSTSYFCLSINNIQNVSTKLLWVRKDYRSVQLLWTSVTCITVDSEPVIKSIIATNSILYLKSKWFKSSVSTLLSLLECGI